MHMGTKMCDTFLQPVIPHEMRYPFKRIFADSAISMRNDVLFFRLPQNSYLKENAPKILEARFSLNFILGFSTS